RHEYPWARDHRTRIADLGLERRARGYEPAVGHHADSMMTASTARLSPALALIFLTRAFRSARRMFSIFMASTTASESPGCTSWPSAALIALTRPGMGQSSTFEVSAAAFAGISAASAASRWV